MDSWLDVPGVRLCHANFNINTVLFLLSYLVNLILIIYWLKTSTWRRNTPILLAENINMETEYPILLVENINMETEYPILLVENINMETEYPILLVENINMETEYPHTIG